MLQIAWFEILVGAVVYAGAMVSASASAQTALEKEISAVTERAYLGPREALYTLAKIQASHSPLSTRHQALVYEQLSHAKFRTNDFSGALRAAILLEGLGKQQRDKSIECLGVLSQVYPYWKMGKIQTAYELARRAEHCSTSADNTSLRAKALVTKAEVESEERQAQAALRTVEEAVRLSNAAHDDALLFMATKTQISLALSSNDIPLALMAVDRLLSPIMRSIYPERLVRAKGLEFAVTSAAGLTLRANLAMTERIRLMRQLQLDEALGKTLVDYSDFQLKGNRYADAEALSKQALTLESVLADEPVANMAHLNHAIARIHLGHVEEGKEEVEQIFKSTGNRAELLVYLPKYVAALTRVGDVDASVQVAALQQQIESEEALYRAKEKSEAQRQIDTLAQLSEMKALEAQNERKQRKMWLIVAGISAIGLIALVGLYGRLRVVNRLLRESNRQLYTSSNRDLLTGVFNRRYMESYVSTLSRDSADCNTTHSPKGGLVLLIDIDNFKQVNDTYGHAVGDQVLEVTAARLSALFRDDDIIARWGGEEFLALLPTTPVSEASGIAERILRAVSAGPIVVSNTSLNVTISVGVCSLRLQLKDREMNWKEVVHIADQSLYLAKQRGRNKAYGITDAVNVTSAEMSRGLRMNCDEGKLELLEVFGSVPVHSAILQQA